MNNTLTASRMGSVAACMRQSFWAYEIGLRKDSVGPALHFGSAWARAMEARWLGATYVRALDAAFPADVRLEPYAVETVSALLAAYYIYYGEREICATIHPEVRFGPSPIEGTGMVADGVMDGLGQLKDGRLAIIESKTTRDDIARGSNYWDRLRFNNQILQYAFEAPKIGWDVDVAFYDVTRKPQLKPKMLDDRDADGMKIVIDLSTGERAMVLKGKKGEKRSEPRQSGGEGFEVQKHLETPDEFGQRLMKDVSARPEFYFARREIPLTDDVRRTFGNHRRGMARLIEFARSQEWDGEGFDESHRDPTPWLRNVREDTCRLCSFRGFCLQNIEPDPSKPPIGFSIQQFNPELERENKAKYDNDSTEEDDSSTAD